MDDEYYLGDDGIVHGISHQDQTEAVATRGIVRMKAELAKTTTPLLLVDLREAGAVSREARALYRDLTIEMTSAANERPVSICFAGGSRSTRTVVKFIIRATGQRELVGFEDTRQAATAWLLRRGHFETGS